MLTGPKWHKVRVQDVGPLTKRGLRKLIEERLRDPETTTKQFLELMEIHQRLGGHSAPEKHEEKQPENLMATVLKLEKEKKNG